MVRSPLCRALSVWLAASFFVVLAAGCCGKDEKKPPSRWDTPAARPTTTAGEAKGDSDGDKKGDTKAAPKAETTAKPTSDPPKALMPPVSGGSFNKFFPPESDGAKRVFSQEKNGYAEAKLQKDGKEIAMLSISDSSLDLMANDRFKSVRDKLQGYPVTTIGKNQTSALVGDRFQVKVSSQTLDDAARRELLGRFDLAGLEKFASSGAK